MWEARWKIGRLLRWDRRDAGVGARATSLRDRLPADLRAAPTGPDLPPFTSVFLLDDEWAAEMANRTVHTVMHIGWVADEDGGYHGQMAVLVKPNGRFGAGVHGRDQAVPLPARLPGADATHRAELAGGRRRYEDPEHVAELGGYLTEHESGASAVQQARITDPRRGTADDGARRRWPSGAC